MPVSFAPPCRYARRCLRCRALGVLLRARLSPFGVAEYAEDLCIADEVIDRWVRVGHALLSHHRRRQGHSGDLELQLMPPMCAQCQGDHVGPIPVAGDLAAGENTPVRGSTSRCSH